MPSLFFIMVISLALINFDLSRCHKGLSDSNKWLSSTIENNVKNESVMNRLESNKFQYLATTETNLINDGLSERMDAEDEAKMNQKKSGTEKNSKFSRALVLFLEIMFVLMVVVLIIVVCIACYCAYNRHHEQYRRHAREPLNEQINIYPIAIRLLNSPGGP